MITPTIIASIFSIGSIFCIICGIAIIQEHTPAGFALLILGPLALRVICENFIVLFTIQNTLTDIRNLLKSQQDRENQ